MTEEVLSIKNWLVEIKTLLSAVQTHYWVLCNKV